MWEGLDRSRDNTMSPLSAVREAEKDMTRYMYTVTIHRAPCRYIHVYSYYTQGLDTLHASRHTARV